MKSTLHNSDDVKGLCAQIKNFVDFLSPAISNSNRELLKEAEEQSASQDVKNELSSLSNTRVPVFGFAYESRIQADTVRASVLLRDDADQIFVLDVPRPWDEIEAALRPLGANPTREDVEKFVDTMRDPNGFSFHVDAFKPQAGPLVVAAKDYNHSIQALAVFVKEISDKVRTQSPMLRPLTAKAAEIAYSTYHKRAGSYA